MMSSMEEWDDVDKTGCPERRVYLDFCGLLPARLKLTLHTVESYTRVLSHKVRKSNLDCLYSEKFFIIRKSGIVT